MKQEEWKSEYPFESHWMRTDGLQYHYVDEGQGEPLLMVHGNPTWSFYWRKIVTAFRNERRCVVPDHIGCGLSEKPQAYPYQLQTHIDNLVALVDRLDLRNVTLLAHDWGGPIGLGAALARQDRLKRFVLFNTGAFPPPFIPWRIRLCRVPLLGRIALQGGNLFSLAAVRMAVDQPRRLSAVARQGLLAPYDQWDHRVAIYRFVKDIPASPSHPTWPVLARIEEQMRTIADRPFLFIWGMRDWCFTPACLERLQQLVPDAQTERIEDAGHWVVEEAADEIVRRLNAFLKPIHSSPSIAGQD